jgi:hypothetical protein
VAVIASYTPTFDKSNFENAEGSFVGQGPTTVTTQGFYSTTFTVGANYFFTALTVRASYKNLNDPYLPRFFGGIYNIDGSNNPTTPLWTSYLTEDSTVYQYGSGSQAETRYQTVYDWQDQVTSTQFILLSAGTYAVVIWQPVNALRSMYAIGQGDGGSYAGGVTKYTTNAGSSWQNTSADFYFKVEGITTTPQTPVIFAPSEASTQPVDVTLTWEDADRWTQSYDVYLDTWPVPGIGSTKVVDDLYVHQYTPPVNLNLSDDYVWRIVAKNIDADSSPGDHSFETGPDIAVSNQAEFQAINTNLTQNYYLTQNITITGNFTPIGNATDGNFSGKIDGRGFTVDFSGATILEGFTGSGNVSPFGLVVTPAIIHDIHLTGVDATGFPAEDLASGFVSQTTATFYNCTTTSPVVEATNYAAGFVAYAANTSSFYNCYAIDVDITGSESFNGGFVGYSSSTTPPKSFQRCYASGEVEQTGGSIGNSGGFVGQVAINSSILDCYANVNVLYSGGGPADNFGGFAGRINSGAIVGRCYSTGTVTASGSTYIGGFVGYLEDGGVVYDNYCDKETSNLENDGRYLFRQNTTTFLNTTPMQKQVTFTNYSFGNANIWNINEDDTYPIFDVMPSAPILLTPSNTATNVNDSPCSLSWYSSNPYGAESYDVWLGTSEAGMVKVGSGIQSTTFEASSYVQTNTKYFWAVVAVGVNGTSQSSTWSFTTLTGFSPPVPGDSSGSGASGGLGFSVNAMKTFRRLVVIADNEIWYEDI